MQLRPWIRGYYNPINRFSFNCEPHKILQVSCSSLRRYPKGKTITKATEPRAHMWDLGDPGSRTLNMPLDLRLDFLICKTARNTVPSGLLQMCWEVILTTLTLLQVWILKIFSKHLLPVSRHFLPLFHSNKSSQSGAGGDTREGAVGASIEDPRLAMSW